LTETDDVIFTGELTEDVEEDDEEDIQPHFWQ
jgi:hypothetical protein